MKNYTVVRKEGKVLNIFHNILQNKSYHVKCFLCIFNLWLIAESQ